MSKKHVMCQVCGEWKRPFEMTATEVCSECFKTHDKYGNPRPTEKPERPKPLPEPKEENFSDRRDRD